MDSRGQSDAHWRHHCSAGGFASNWFRALCRVCRAHFRAHQRAEQARLRFFAAALLLLTVSAADPRTRPNIICCSSSSIRPSECTSMKSACAATEAFTLWLLSVAFNLFARFGLGLPSAACRVGAPDCFLFRGSCSDHLHSAHRNHRHDPSNQTMKPTAPLRCNFKNRWPEMARSSQCDRYAGAGGDFKELRSLLLHPLHFQICL
jgi:hypothetical protein